MFQSCAVQDPAAVISPLAGFPRRRAASPPRLSAERPAPGARWGAQDAIDLCLGSQAGVPDRYMNIYEIASFVNIDTKALPEMPQWLDYICMSSIFVYIFCIEFLCLQANAFKTPLKTMASIQQFGLMYAEGLVRGTERNKGDFFRQRGQRNGQRLAVSSGAISPPPLFQSLIYKLTALHPLCFDLQGSVCAVGVEGEAGGTGAELWRAALRPSFPPSLLPPAERHLDGQSPAIDRSRCGRGEGQCGGERGDRFGALNCNQ